MRRKGLAAILGISGILAALVWGNRQDAVAAAKTTITSLDYSYTNLYDTDTVQKDINAQNPKTVVSGGKLSLDLAEKYGTKDKGYAFTQGSGRLYASLNGKGRRKLEWSGETDKFQDGSASVYAPVITAGKKNVWDTKNLPYFETEFSTKGYEDVTFSASIGATKKGPKSYKMAYRIGSSGNYSTLFYNSASVTLTKNKQFVRISATLPASVKDQDKVMVRIYAAEAATVGGGTLSDNPTGGKIGINHILVEGSTVSTAKNTSGAAKLTVGRASISKAVLKKKKVTVSIKKVAGAAGYQVQVASDKKMKKNRKSVSVKSGKAVLKKWKRKKCYVRVRAYKTDAQGKRVYGKWSSVKKVKKGK